MKNLLNTLVVLFLALTYTMAELVPNCSHVLHFSDEEVEFLQKIVTKKHKDLYEMFFKTIDSALTEKYPPHRI